jgi:POT family proton-dependent oligopeptide transporter
VLAQYLYPAIRRFHGSCRPLLRMSLGMIMAALSFLAAGLVQLYIDNSSHKISIAWQVPQQALIGAAETMIAVTGLEFAYTECRQHMGSLIQAAWSLMQLGQFLTGAVALGRVKAYVVCFMRWCVLMM